MKHLFSCLFLCLCALVSLESDAQLASGQLGLTGPIADSFDRCTANPYSPSNAVVGDSLIALSHDGRERNVFVAGLMLKAYANIGLGDFNACDSLLTIVVDHSFVPELKTVFYLAYQFKASVRMLNNDYHGTLKSAQEMCRYAELDHSPLGGFVSYYTMGTAFVMRDNPRLAYRYFSLAAKCAEENQLKEKLWATYFQLANCYSAMNDYDNAQVYAKKAIESAKESGNEMLVRRAILGSLLVAPKLYSKDEYIGMYEKECLSPDFSALVPGEEMFMIRAQYLSYKGRVAEAIALCDSIETGVNGLNSKELIYVDHELWKEAYDARFKATMIHDSLQALIQLEDFAALDSEMNNAELRDKAEKLQTRNRQILVLAIFAVVLVVLGFVILQYRQRQKQMRKQKEYLEAEVKRQVAELEQKSRIIEQKNRDITDSITYAQRIQNAILPDLKEYAKFDITGAFTFFMPYNIVSGDFYWANRKDNLLMFACADCTGHGVPGAFMSMIGTTILNEVCASEGTVNPAEVLEMVDAELLKVLSQNNTSGVQDGMDMSFVVYDCDTHVVRFAAARRPVYLFQSGALQEIKGTKRSIGDRDEVCRQNKFESHEFTVLPGDTLYVCSDGIADQFGGQNEYGHRGKRLMSGGLKRMLEKIYPLDIEEQRAAIESLYLDWRGTCMQVDDVSLLGVRF